MKFRDGTIGSVLLVRFSAEDGFPILINSPERDKSNPRRNFNQLFPEEINKLYAYRKACKERYNNHYRISKDMYEEFGAVRLTDTYISAIIADFICININQNYINHPGVPKNWNTGRLDNLLHNALTGCKMGEIEDEIIDFESEDCKWSHDIIVQTLSLYDAKKLVTDFIHINWDRTLSKYLEWLERKPKEFKLCVGQIALKAYKEHSERSLWRILEDSLRREKELTAHFPYSNYGIQEIIGLYAICKYLYTEKPQKIELRYAHVDTKERIALFELYSTNFTKEMLVRLNNDDNPFRNKLPDKEEAEETAKREIAKLIGRQPEDLPSDQKKIYAQYEQGFCMGQGINTTIQEKPSNTIRTTQDEAPIPTINDMEKLFLPCYTRLPDCGMLLNTILDDREKVSDADWARYALTIYDCRKIFKNHPKSFKDWLPIFCNLFGREVEYRAPSDLRRTKCKTDLTAFLPKL